MHFVEDYIEYLRDNPEGYWFKRKLYGFGWMPARRQGWITLGVYLTFVFGLIIVAPNTLAGKAVFVKVVAPILGATVILLLISWKTGEPLKWQWGRSRSLKNVE